MKRTLLKTGDGSFTLHIPEWNEQYHSKNGAVAEALHVFIREGLHYLHSLYTPSEVSILEIGFGTGLNCLLTFLEAEKNAYRVNYTGVEGFPLNPVEAKSLNYPDILHASYINVDSGISEIGKVFSIMHDAPWEKSSHVAENFVLQKQEKSFSEIEDESKFNLIYFDAFGIRVQPELWTEEIFKKMFNALKPNGILVTYAANGNARRALQKVGFSIERLEGPPGKREMLRATKQSLIT